MPHETIEMGTVDESNPQFELPIRPWRGGARKSVEMTPAERRAEIIQLLAKGVIRMRAASRMQTEIVIKKIAENTNRGEGACLEMKNEHSQAD